MRLGATAVGWRAHAALGATGGRARVIAALSGSCYATAGAELVWLGREALLHPRAVIVDAPAVAIGDVIRIAPDMPAPWRPGACAAPSGTLRDGAHAWRPALAALGPPRGLGRLLVAGPSADGDVLAERGALLIARARDHARHLAHACTRDDHAGAVEPARALLGLGDGLTPSGDDYVGGALFARRAVHGPSDAWDGVVERILHDAGSRTHPVSACLLRDLANGHGWAPLHDLAAALAGRDAAAAQHAARALITLGSSSGWDILAGFVAALTADA